MLALQHLNSPSHLSNQVLAATEVNQVVQGVRRQLQGVDDALQNLRNTWHGVSNNNFIASNGDTKTTQSLSQLRNQ